MTSRTLSLPDSRFARQATAARARSENLVALAFAVFAAMVLSLALLPPHPPSDPTEIDALEIVSGP